MAIRKNDGVRKLRKPKLRVMGEAPAKAIKVATRLFWLGASREHCFFVLDFNLWLQFVAMLIAGCRWDDGWVGSTMSFDLCPTTWTYSFQDPVAWQRSCAPDIFNADHQEKRVLPVYQCCGIALLWCNAVYISPRYGWKPDFYTDGSSGGCSGSAMDCGHASGMPQQNIGLTPLRRRWICVLCMSDPEKDQPCFKWIPKFNCCQVEQSTQDLCKQFYYQSLLFFNQFALQWGSLGHKPWSVYGSLECIGTTLNCTMCFHLSTHVFPFPKWTSVNPRMKENWGYCADDAVRAGITYPGQSDLTHSSHWWEMLVWGSCGSSYPSLIVCKVEKMQPWPPEIREVGTTAWSGSVTWQVLNGRNMKKETGRRWKEYWRWKSVCEIRLKQELLDVATCTGTIRQESVSPWWRLELPTCDEPLGLLTWPG